MHLHVENMTCGHCRATVTKAIASVDPDATVAVDLSSGMVDVASDAAPEALIAAIRAEGYDVRAV